VVTYAETEQIEDGKVVGSVWPRGDLSFDIDDDGRVLAVHRINDQVRPRDLEDVIRELRHPDAVEAAARERVAAYIERAAELHRRPGGCLSDGLTATAWAQVAEWCRDDTIWNSNDEETS
jgi:hypothetical protein